MSDVNSVTFTTAGGSQSVLGTSVTQMRRIEDAFYVEDVGSTLLLESTTIEQNRIQSNPWSAVSARTGSIVRVSETTISDNAAVEFGIVAFDSSATIIDSFISRNEGSVSGFFVLFIGNVFPIIEAILTALNNCSTGIHYHKCTSFCNYGC